VFRDAQKAEKEMIAFAAVKTSMAAKSAGAGCVGWLEERMAAAPE